MRPYRWTILLLLLGATPTAAQRGDPWKRHTIDASSRGADGVKLGDVNGDRLTDIATGWEEGGRVRLYLNPGPDRAARPWPRVTVGSVGSPEDAVPVDLDGDGAVDVISACEGETRALFVHWAPREGARRADPAAWTTERLSGAPHGQQWMQILPMDVDGRGAADLVVGSKGEDGVVGWLAAPDDPRQLGAWRFHRLSEARWIMSLAAADLDRDGDADVLLSERRGEDRGVFWLENPGAAATRAGAAWRRHRVGAAGREVMFVDLADLDGDSRPEVIAAVRPAEIVVLRQTSDPIAPWTEDSFQLPSAGIGTAKAVRIVDLDLDGRKDLVFSFEEALGPRSGVVWARLLAGTPTAIGPLLDIGGPAGVKFDLIGLADLDADGDPDLVTTEERDGLGVVWYENPSR